MEKLLKDSFFGPSSSIFIGRKGYPKVAVGPMAVMEEAMEEIMEDGGVRIELLEDPKEWFHRGFGMEKIIEMRSAVLRCKRKEHVVSKFSHELREMAMAKHPPDIEVYFKSKPSYKISFSDILQPTGPSASMEKMKICGNTRIARKVESIVSDDLKAEEAANALYSAGLDVYKIAIILSSGALGGKDKKMVPTRWSITATDDIIFRKLASQVKDFPPINSFLVYESSYMDNH
ncbi:MAG: hypothetical protein ACXQTS_04375, partial [Candidatus Methanospirareceae archaeon]